jgi:hypothetical protein
MLIVNSVSDRRRINNGGLPGIYNSVMAAE